MRFLRTEYLSSVLLPLYGAPSQSPAGGTMYDRVEALTRSHVDLGKPIPLSLLSKTF
jgi:hypothetical protein